MFFKVSGANLLLRLSKNEYVILFLTVKAGPSNTFNSSRKNIIKVKCLLKCFLACVKQLGISKSVVRASCFQM